MTTRNDWCRVRVDEHCSINILIEFFILSEPVVSLCGFPGGDFVYQSLCWGVIVLET